MSRWLFAMVVVVAAVVTTGCGGGGKELAPPTPAANENLTPEQIKEKMDKLMPAAQKAEMEKRGMKMPGGGPPATPPAK